MDCLPIPTGPHQVGTTKFDLEDSHRKEIAYPEGRLIPIQVYFPMEPGPHFLHPKIFEERGHQSGISLKTDVYSRKADLSTLANGLHPIVFLNHANTVSMTDYGFLAEDLASHGYVVITIQHQLKTDPEEPSYWDHKSFSLHARVIDNLLYVFEWLKCHKDDLFQQRLSLNDVALIGHSMGGNALLFLANRISYLQEKHFFSREEQSNVKECIIVLDTGNYPYPKDNRIPLFFLFSEERVNIQIESGKWDDMLKIGHKVQYYSGSKHISFMDHGYVNPADGNGPYFNGSLEERKIFFDVLRKDIRAFLEKIFDEKIP